MQVRVHASSVDPKTGIKEHTNDFYFRFNVMGTVNLPQVLPRTYAESIMYLDGKRHMFWTCEQEADCDAHASLFILYFQLLYKQKISF